MYWKPVYYALERGFEMWLCNAHHVKNVPGRKTDITPILAGVRSPRMGRKPAHWTSLDRDYERIRIDMQNLFTNLAIETPLAA